MVGLGQVAVPVAALAGAGAATAPRVAKTAMMGRMSTDENMLMLEILPVEDERAWWGQGSVDIGRAGWL